MNERDLRFELLPKRQNLESDQHSRETIQFLKYNNVKDIV